MGGGHLATLQLSIDQGHNFHDHYTSEGDRKHLQKCSGAYVGVAHPYVSRKRNKMSVHGLSHSEGHTLISQSHAAADLLSYRRCGEAKGDCGDRKEAKTVKGVFVNEHL